MKAVLIICDGAADRPLKDLGWRTPLEVAEKPALDRLAKLGINGTMYTVAPGIPPGSDTAHLALLGYDPEKVYRGRGAFEALGTGLEVKPGDVAFRYNLAYVDKDMVVKDRRAGRIRTEDALRIAASLEKLKIRQHPRLRVLLRHSTEHRGALILRGPELSPNVTDSDPEQDNSKVVEVKPTDRSREAAKTAGIVNELTRMTYRILRNHPLNVERERAGLKPANILIFRGAGVLPSITPLTDIYGVRAACIVPNALVKGVARAAGMVPVEVEGATGTVETDTVAKAKAVVSNLQNFDLFLIHVKGTDNASHDGNPEQKIGMIQKIDRMVGFLLDNLNLEETCIALAPDHATPLTLRKHSGDQVPVTVACTGVIRDDVETFSERSCAKGGLGRILGKHLMPILMNLLGRTRKFGA